MILVVGSLLKRCNPSRIKPCPRNATLLLETSLNVVVALVPSFWFGPIDGSVNSEKSCPTMMLKRRSEQCRRNERRPAAHYFEAKQTISFWRIFGRQPQKVGRLVASGSNGRSRRHCSVLPGRFDAGGRGRVGRKSYIRLDPAYGQRESRRLPVFKRVRWCVLLFWRNP